ncbi:hypothetical protein J008_01791 [Cryptococcus neoformans]|nr:hypothetical protein J008_01791 [Cryptococcus neoformans var. grubii]
MPPRRQLPSFSLSPELMASLPEEFRLAIDAFDSSSTTSDDNSPEIVRPSLDTLPGASDLSNAIIGDEGDVSDDDEVPVSCLPPSLPLVQSPSAPSSASSSVSTPPLSPSALLAASRTINRSARLPEPPIWRINNLRRTGRRTIDGPREEEPHDPGHSPPVGEDERENFMHRMNHSSPPPLSDGEHGMGRYESGGDYSGYENGFMPSQSPVAADSLHSNTSDSAPPPTHPRRPRSSSHRSISTITSFENSFGEEEPWEEYRRLVNESRVFCMLMWEGLWICQGWDSIRNKPVSIALGLSPT